ncbi:MAG: hypothetical protein IT385_14350 [Deltaproteobacteria bacterium]|nr:hypothetical protein [Deltaproteobacteria bacterium]
MRALLPPLLACALGAAGCLSNPTPHPGADAQNGGETTAAGDTTVTGETSFAGDAGPDGYDAAPPFDPDSYPEPKPYPPAGTAGVEIRGAFVADLDGDAADDLVAADASDGQFGFFVLRGGPGLDLTAYDIYVRTHARPLAFAALRADADARIDLAVVGRGAAAGPGYLELDLARGGPFVFASPLIRDLGDGFPDASAGAPVSLVARDLTGDGVVDFVVADATRVTLVAPADTSTQGFSEAPTAPLASTTEWTSAFAILVVSGETASDDHLLVLERERLSAFTLPLPAGVSSAATTTGALPFGGTARVGAVAATIGGEATHDLLAFAGTTLYAIRTSPGVGTAALPLPESLSVGDGSFDAIAALDLDDDDTPDALLLDHSELTHLGRTSLTLYIDLYVADGALRSPFAPVRYKLPEGYDPVVMTHGELDGDPAALEIITFALGGEARCYQVVRSTHDIGPCP